MRLYGRKLKIGDVVFVRGEGLISSLIRYFDGEFSHCAIYIGQGKILESQRFVGARIANWYFKDVEVLPMNLTNEEKIKVLNIAIYLDGNYPYDYTKLLGYAAEKIFGFDRKQFWNNRSRLICSEVIDYVLGFIEKIPKGEYYGDRTPNELYRILSKAYGQ